MTLEQRIDRMDKKLTSLLTREKQETWVTAYVIYEATGWDHKKLRVMRKEGVVRWDELKKRYLLESIPKVFLKNQQTNTV